MKYIIIALLFISALLLIKKLFSKCTQTHNLILNDILLNTDELKRHAKDAAEYHLKSTESCRKHKLSSSIKGMNCLLKRLDDNYAYIFSVYKDLCKYSASDIPLCPASIWLLDNFYIIEEQYRDIKILNKKTYSKTIILNKGYLKGYPRIFAVALELVSHTSGRLDKNTIIEFVNSYQTISILNMFEIWNMSLVLRIALIEYLRFVCETIDKIQHDWIEVEKLKNKSNADVEDFIKFSISSMEKPRTSYIEHLLKFLRAENIDEKPIIKIIEAKLLSFDTSIEQVINRDHQEQSQIQNTIGNLITSLRFMISADWNVIFEQISYVEKILNNDPAGIYSKQDFETRDYYRHQLEAIARNLNLSETNTARAILKLSSTVDDIKKPEAHIGYYLIGNGKKTLYNEYKQKLKTKSNSQVLSLYLAAAGIITISLLTLLLYLIKPGTALSIIIFAAGFAPFFETALFLENWIITHHIQPDFLPKIKYKNDIPVDKKTVVIVPTLLSGTARVKKIIEKLEISYLANNEKNIYFAVIGDFSDSDSYNMPQDKDITDSGFKLIKDLNNKYSKSNDIFFLLIRNRIYNKSQNKWIGWERKRGAIVEFIGLLKGKPASFGYISGDISNLKDTNYIITLDADTVLPIGAASKLIGTISHPLNQPVYDKKRGIVTSGYGIIQPKILISKESSSKSKFSCLFAGQGGIDAYSFASFDLYQDLFGEAVFTGKGIFDINTYYNALLTSIPDNTVLSHDIIEGSYMRVGLVSDIQLIDGYPEKFSSYMARQHRWVRGDWQALKWLYPYVLKKDGRKIRNSISYLSRWKITDNLIRSLVPVGLTVLLIAGIFLPLISTSYILAFVIISIVMPVLTSAADYLLYKGYKSSIEHLNGNIIYGFKAAILQCSVTLSFLPYNAYMMADAIFRTLYREYISHKNMLEWVTAADAEDKLNNSLASYVRKMKSVIYFSIILTVLSIIFNISDLTIYLPLSLLFCLSPYIAFDLSCPYVEQKKVINNEDTEMIKKICRKTWGYFEEFAGADNNFLPCDNFQEKPVEKTAQRTSPTNIGFLLLSILSARDLGYITTSKLSQMVDDTLKTIEKLEKWNGHLYNWYDTQTLDILNPRYISTVDSGNFIGYLMVLYSGILDYINKPLLDAKIKEGLIDTIKTYDNDNIHESIVEMLNSSIKSGTDLREFYEMLNSIKNYPLSYQTVMLVEDILNEIKQFYPEKYYKNKIDDNLNYTELSLVDLYNLYKDQEHATEETAILLNNAGNRVKNLQSISERIKSLIDNTHFDVLYDFKRGLFSIGFNVNDNKLTNSYYDLLSSEARLASYIAVCRREVPVSHWFKLGRSIVLINKYLSLVSWTGTMFEYFMPSLLMKVHKDTLLSETYMTVIRSQIKYGKDRNLPWGTSESGLYMFDLNLNYQYKAFGVPDLGLKRGLINDMVVSPYSTILALPYNPLSSIINIKKLIDEGAEGKFGLYEALDYTPGRIPKDNNHAIVTSFMSHHQGMILASFNNYFNNNIIVERFHSIPLVKTGEYLLYEKIPVRLIITKEHKEEVKPFERKVNDEVAVTRLCGYKTDFPEAALLSNGSYSLMIDNWGYGYSKCDNIFLTRWKNDLVSRRYGLFFYVKNINTEKIWSNTLGPIMQVPDKYEVKFSEDKTEFARTDGDIETHTEICVTPEDNCEIRKITFTNHGTDDVIIECTSFFEVVISEHAQDLSHPAFNNLFVRTEIIKEQSLILSSRRLRDDNSHALWAYHTLCIDGNQEGDIEFETDKYKFIGRSRNVSNPKAISLPLTNSQGSVIEPVMSIRRRVKIEPQKTAVFAYITGYTEEKNEAIEISKKYQEINNIERAFGLSYIRNYMERKYLSIKPYDIECFDKMIPHIIYQSPLKSKYSNMIIRNIKGQSGLWTYGISGDIPIILVTIKSADDIDIAKKMIMAHEYFSAKGLKTDLVILNQEEENYFSYLQNLIIDTILSSNTSDILDRPCGIFVRKESIMPDDDVVLIHTAAKIIIRCEDGNINNQIRINKQHAAALKPMHFYKRYDNSYTENKNQITNLIFFNDFGGFDKDNNEYAIILKDYYNTPAPWSNVISNRNFGFLITESGGGYVWAENSRENKLTPWSNDPVSDTPYEIIYVRNDITGEVWTITPLPVREKETYEIRHGTGYTKFFHTSHGIKQGMIVYAAENDPVKITLLKFKNISNYRKELSVYYSIRPVLGVNEENTEPDICTDFIKADNLLTFNNIYTTDFYGRTAYMGTSLDITSYTADRMEFLGKDGDLAHPAALNYETLSGSTGYGFNTCGVLQCKISLDINEEKEFSFIFGEEKSIENVKSASLKYKSIDNCTAELNNVINMWKGILDTIQVKTPDAAMDLLLNQYLLYQTTACRLWGRSAFYQSGGAYGFRDQLQDVLSLAYSEPFECKNQILKSAAHQFVEGDVLHWWHPLDIEKGIRTKFSDDLLWLPYTTAEYIERTGDYDLLKSEVNFLEGDELSENESEKYEIPKKTDFKSTIYDHCTRAIEKALKFGPHNIPLIGSGDWNDGMNTIGNKNNGESVWLGFFLYATINKFIKLCRYMDDLNRAAKYEKILKMLSYSLEEDAWDGNWYRRAYFDDGTPLGSMQNSECKIDSIAQSWAVISGAASFDRMKTSMNSVENYLINYKEGLILLFTPPFDTGYLKPGYIRGYVPGVRENGGQYTHAAVWVIYAYSLLNMGDKAVKLYDLINPINHTKTSLDCDKYKVEPYVMAADVYAAKPYTGRGGWTWYTGSSSWMYRIGLEEILGLHIKGNSFTIKPCIPENWSEYKITYKYKSSIYNINIQNKSGSSTDVKSVKIDNKILADNTVSLFDDGLVHFVEVIM